MTQMSRMFDVLLNHLDMKYGKLGEKRTTYSLRHTSLIFNLSQPNVDQFDILVRIMHSIFIRVTQIFSAL